MKLFSRVTILVVLWTAAVAAQAQFLIVPKGQQAGSVSAKRVKAEMHAYGAYATIRLEMAFKTDPDWTDEVDFMVKLPENTEATAFAYWFQDEYVKAKTVDKQRALAIYEFITTRRRDPALIELVGRRQFRVRIAPVDVTKDLKVELKLVVTPTQGALTLPLTDLFPRQLESADLTLTTPNDEGWKENWGRPFEVKEGRRVYRFESKPYKAKSDWRAAYVPSRRVVSVGRPDSGEGTILVSWTAAQPVSGVKLAAPKGVLTHLYPTRPVSLKAGETVTFAARVSAAAPVSVKLALTTSGGSSSWDQALPQTAFEDRSAVVAWGARHLAALKDREEIRKWGLWLGVPSKETSWLAVPKAEEAMLKEARAAWEVQQYWLAVSKQGRNSSLATKQMVKVDFHLKEAYGADWKSEKEWRLKNGWWSATWLLSQQYAKAVAARGQGSSSAKDFNRGLARLHVYKKDDWWYEISEVKESALETALNDRVDGLLGQSEEPLSASQRSAAKSEMTRLWNALPKAKDAYNRLPYSLRDALVRAEAAQVGDLTGEERKQALKDAATVFSILPLFGRASDLRAEARSEVVQSSFYDLANKWQAFPGEGKPRMTTDALIKSIETKLKKYRVSVQQARPALLSLASSYLHRHPKEGYYYEPDPDPRTLDLTEDQKAFAHRFGLNKIEILRERWGHMLSSQAWNLYRMEAETRRDPKAYQEAMEKLAAWAKVLEMKIPALTGPGYQRSLRDQYVISVRKLGANHPQSLELRRKMEEADGVNTPRGKYRADILLTELELDSLLWRTRTPEESELLGQLEKKRRELFARMGDPLLIVSAPQDAKVSTLLPDGRLVSLTWNGQSQRWEHRFDLPPGSKEGEVTIPVWIRHAKGQVESLKMKVNVDQSAPDLRVEWTRTAKGWKVEAWTESGVARVNLSLADGRRLSLTRLADRGDLAHWAIEVEGELAGEAVVIATDSAHNRREARRSFSP